MLRCDMGEMRKITVEVPADLLDRAQAYTGGNLDDTICEALKRLDSVRAQQEFRKLRGTLTGESDINALREDQDPWPPSTPQR